MTDETRSVNPASQPAGKTKLLPYRVVEGVPTFTDSQLAHVFAKAKAERLLPLVMYNLDPNMTAATFVRFYKNDLGRLLWLVFYDGKLAGWVWLDDFANRAARSHFCFFRWVSEARLTEEVGRETFRQLFNMKFRGGTMLQVIRAEMPAFNKPALWFLEKLGLKIVGEIPNGAYRSSTGKFYPMIYLYATKDLLKSDCPSVELITPLVGSIPDRMGRNRLAPTEEPPSSG